MKGPCRASSRAFHLAQGGGLSSCRLMGHVVAGTRARLRRDPRIQIGLAVPHRLRGELDETGPAAGVPELGERSQSESELRADLRRS